MSMGTVGRKGYAFRLGTLAALVMVLGCSTVPIDTALSAEKGNAKTVVLCGWGECRRGYIAHEIAAESGTTAVLRIVHSEALKCGRDSCVEFKFFNPDGSQGYGGAIPEGEREAAFTLGDVIQSDVIRPEHDDEWLVKMVVWWKDDDGEIRRAYQFGLLRVMVTDALYQRLTCGGPAVAWTSEPQERCEAHFTTAGRSAVCGDGCKND